MRFVILILLNLFACTTTIFSPINRRKKKTNNPALIPSVCNRDSYWSSLNLAEMPAFKHLEEFRLTETNSSQLTGMNCTGITSIRQKNLPKRASNISKLEPAIGDTKLVYTSHENYLKYICELIACGQECFELGQRRKFNTSVSDLPL